MQKKIRRIIFLFVIFCFGCLPVLAQTTIARNNLVSETTRYMEQNNIHFQKAGYEYSNNDGRQIFTVKSQDPTVFESHEPFQKTVAVMNVKSTDGTAGIYVTEATYSQGRITYDLKRNGQTIDSEPVIVSVIRKNPGTRNDPPVRQWCPEDVSWERAQQLLEEARAYANETCGFVLVFYQIECTRYNVLVEPTSPNCRPVTWSQLKLQAVVRANVETFSY